MKPNERLKHTRRLPGWQRRLVAVLTSVALACGLVVAAGGAAQAAPHGNHRMATWNMLHSPDNNWDRAFRLAQDYDVVALQEVPQRLPHDLTTGSNNNPVNDPGEPVDGNDSIRRYEWTRDGVVRWLYILHTDSQDIGFITEWEPDQVLEVDGVHRPALTIVNRADDILFASLHAESGDANNGGNDAGSLLRRIATTAQQNGVGHWVAMGDFNREPGQLGALNPPRPAWLFRPFQATQQRGRELDYAVANFDAPQWRPAQALENAGSDHWPVAFGTLRASAEPPTVFTIGNDTNGGVFNPERESTTNGTYVDMGQPAGRPTEGFRLVQVDPGKALSPRQLDEQNPGPVYHIQLAGTNKCLDVDGGQQWKKGSRLNIWECNPASDTTTTQNFRLLPVQGSGGVELQNVTSGLVANILGADKGNFLGLWDKDDKPNEIFHLRPTPAVWKIGNDRNGGVFDAEGQSTANKTHVNMYEQTGGSNQNWQLVEQNPGTGIYHIQLADTNKCLDVDGGQQWKKGDRLNIWECNPASDTTTTQNFRVLSAPNNDGVEFYNVTSGLVANILGADKGDFLGLWDKDDKPNEIFHLQLQSIDVPNSTTDRPDQQKRDDTGVGQTKPDQPDAGVGQTNPGQPDTGVGQTKPSEQNN